MLVNLFLTIVSGLYQHRIANTTSCDLATTPMAAYWSFRERSARPKSESISFFSIGTCRALSNKEDGRALATSVAGALPAEGDRGGAGASTAGSAF